METARAAEKARGVRVAVFDVDGILTDGTLYLSDSGEEMKAFNSRDGHGLRMLQDAGVTLAILTGRRSRCVEHRCRDLGISHVLQGVKDKRAGLEELQALLGVTADVMAYMGDDVIDLPVLRRCRFAITVPEAPAIVQANVDYITTAGGGRGAVREVCEFILQAQGLLSAQLARYLA